MSQGLEKMGDGLGLACLELKFGSDFTGSSVSLYAGILYNVVPSLTGSPRGPSFLSASGLVPCFNCS